MAEAGRPTSEHSGQAVFYIAVVAGLAAVGGLLFGYDTGVISGALLYIEKDFRLSDAMQGLVVSAVTLGALVGALAGGTLADRIGRRSTNIGAGLLFILASLICAFAPGVPILIGGRLVVGLAIGLTSVAAPMYIAEVAPARIRGSMVTLFQLAITIGIVVAYGVDEGFSASGSWRWMLGLAVIPGALLAFGLIPMPSSPRWLMRQGREDEARAVLEKIRAGAEVEPEIDEIRADVEAEGSGTWRDLGARSLRPALSVGVGLAVFQQVTGINAVLYYAPKIFQSAGFSSDFVALAATIGIGVVNVLATFIAIWLVDRAGRRPLLIVGTAGMTLTLAVLGFAFDESAAATPEWLGVLTIVCLSVYVVFFAFSLGPIVWLMISEIFPSQYRAPAMAVSAASNWAANFVVSLTFPMLRAAVGSSATFFLYAAFGVLAVVFIVARVPETRGRTLEEIEALWH